MRNSEQPVEEGGEEPLFDSEEERLAWIYRTMRDFLECRRLRGDRDPTEPPTWDDYEGDEEAQEGLATSHRIRRIPGSGSIVDPLNAHRLDLEEERGKWLQEVRPHVLRLLQRWRPARTREEALEEVEATTSDRSVEEFIGAEVLKALRFACIDRSADTLRDASLGEFTESLHRTIAREVVQDLTSHLDRPDQRKDVLIEDHVDQMDTDRTMEDVLGALVGGEPPQVEAPRYRLRELREAAAKKESQTAMRVLNAILEVDPSLVLQLEDSESSRKAWTLNISEIARQADLTRYKVKQGLEEIRQGI